MHARLLIASLLVAMTASLPAAFSQEKKGGPPTDGPPKGKAPFTIPKAGDLKKYDEVVTKDVKTQAGVFAVHTAGEKVMFEIPQDSFGKLMLWTAEVAKGPGGSSWGGAALGDEVVKWERRGNKVYLWKVGFKKRATGKAVQAAVEASSTDSIIAMFNVEAEGKDRSAVITVTNLFLSGLADLSLSRAGGGASGIDELRSYISDVKAFPMNIEARSLLTFRGGGGGGLPSPFGGGGGGKSTTALVHQSLVMLPETPMMGRYFDPRVGYFTEEYTDYSHPRGWAQGREFITRFRLEKKDAMAEVSEPIKPITFYISREVPEQWRPYLKKGVEDWKPVFEKAGFKNAIVCKDAPTAAEDPNWDPEDARHSVIRWVAEPVANAMGPHVHDPRSGEIISAHILFYHDIAKLTQMWYFVQCSGVDEKARQLPLPQDLTGELIRYVAAHEVGHTLGLRHNHRASQAYSVAQLRDPAFTAKHGSVASIMSYGRYNYVAQPEDGIKALIPIMAPYDFFAINWGYRPIPEASSPEAERGKLDEWAAEQITNPFLRFGGEDGPSQVDPTVLTENIGSDPIEATAMGLKNLDRVMGHLVKATTTKGEDYKLLKETYEEVMGHRNRWLGAVAKQVGGVVENRTLAGRGDITFVRVPADKQAAAVKFLLENAFATPTKFIDPKVVNQFRYTGVASDVASQQRALLGSLLASTRMARLFDAELQDGAKAYTATKLVNDLQDGIFGELKAADPKIDPLRRQLQRGYLDVVKKEFVETPAGAITPTGPAPKLPLIGDTTRTSELRSVARVALRRLETQLVAAKATDPSTAAHVEDLLAEVRDILKGKN